MDFEFVTTHQIEWIISNFPPLSDTYNAISLNKIESEVFRKRKSVANIKLFNFTTHQIEWIISDFLDFQHFLIPTTPFPLKKVELWSLEEEKNYYFKYKTFLTLSLSLYAPNRMNYFGFPARFSDTYKHHFP